MYKNLLQNTTIAHRKIPKF